MSDGFSIPGNLTDGFFKYAKSVPHKMALVFPREGGGEEIWSYGQLALLVNKFRNGLDKQGFQVGDRIIVILPLSAELYAFLGALFANGVIPVFLDPNMSFLNFMRSLQPAGAVALVSTKAFLKHRFYLPPLWQSRLFCCDRAGLFMRHWNELKSEAQDVRPTVKMASEDQSLISFTSGTTGRRPKGIDRRHGILAYQRFLNDKSWPYQPDDVDYCAFPLVVLMNLNRGMTTVIPDLDTADPKKIVRQLHRWQITRMSASPAVFANLTAGGIDSKDIPSCFRSLVTGGAAVPRWLAQKIQHLFGHSENSIVYGSTEAEPICGISMEEFIAADDEGYLVGPPLSGVEVNIFNPKNLDLNQPLLGGKIGEVLLNGPHVVKEYIGNSRDNQYSKPQDDSGQIYHRTGDLGRFDQKGRLWLMGRIHRQVVIGHPSHSTYPFEHRAENVLGGKRVALVQQKGQLPTLLVETCQNIPKELELFNHCIGLKKIDNLPVDSRHNWRIDYDAINKKL